MSSDFRKTSGSVPATLENKLAKLASDFSEIWANSKVIGKMYIKTLETNIKLMKLKKNFNGISGHTKSTYLIINIIKRIKKSRETLPLTKKKKSLPRGSKSGSSFGQI